MTKKPATARAYAAAISQHAANAHDEFIARTKQATARAKKAAATAGTCDVGDIAARRRHTMLSAEALGIVEALRRYGGPRTGILKVAEPDRGAFIDDVGAILEAGIQALNARVARLTRGYFNAAQDSNKQLDTRSTLLVTVGLLEGYKRVLALFNECFGPLRKRIAGA
jgi:hypothetical protein